MKNSHKKEINELMKPKKKRNYEHLYIQQTYKAAVHVDKKKKANKEKCRGRDVSF